MTGDIVYFVPKIGPESCDVSPVSARLIRLPSKIVTFYMKNVLFFSLFLLFSPQLATAQSGQITGDRGVATDEQRRFEFMVRVDTAGLSPYLSADLVYIHSNGLVETKTEHLQAIANGKLVYKLMERENVKIRRYGKIAISNGVLHVAGILNQNPFDIRLLYTAVYQKSKSKWQLLNWQSTRI